MKKYLLSLIILLFIGCGRQDTILNVSFVDDCQNKILNDKVNVKITKIGLGKIGELVVPVGTNKGISIVLDDGKYNLECSGLGKGLLSSSKNWKKTVTLVKGQRLFQRFSCVRQYD